MQLQESDIKHLAELSRITISDEDAKKYADDFSSILTYVSEIQSVDVPYVQDISSVSNVFREDVLKDSQFKDDFLSQVPETEGGYVKVKQIL